MTEPLILTERLTRRFGPTMAVDALTLTIDRGEIFGFLGHNGAGKTTTVRLLNGVLTPTAGRMTVLGLDPVTQGAQVRQQTGVLTETPALDDRLTARESLHFAAELYCMPVAQIDRQVITMLTTFGLRERADDQIGTYSKGMRQRLALARTILHDPQLIFLDEPTSGLDPVATRDVHELIIRLSRTQGRTVFLCTHNLIEAQRLCDRVAVLAHGRLLALGTPAELAQQFGRNQQVQVVVEPAQIEQALPLLAAWPGVTAVQPDNHAAGALTLQGVLRPVIPQLITALVQANISIYSVVATEPTLEEVYIGLQTAVAGSSVQESPEGELPT
jgi:ABC-2 type transport system ATP-binding protein